ncbi:leucine-rich repeats and immunoglobulin-like domains protein 3 [Lytechinus variegatus]|uniref:leucine-rich repeats and immunoglobulin-like domains protein 3 n=1 Tax=Lytechinus variegatus TaxID=7654 RepID=UPI001BB12E96|nr:leucine-rich repeats and immunoglobulin-like domains protein 3 [Lytechinus variegatus]
MASGSRRQAILLLELMLLFGMFGIFCSEQGGISTGVFPWCPPNEYVCTCSLRGNSTTDDGESGNDTIMMISCESTNIHGIIDNVKNHLASNLEIHVGQGSGDQILHSLAFSNFSMLRYLDLSSNSITELEPGAFHDAIGLTRLNLSHNLLNGLTYDTFSGVLLISNSSIQYGLPNLKELILANNDISVIQEGAFDGLMALRFLDLSENRISEIGNFTFTGLQGLTVLNLAGNIIQHLHSGMWGSLSEVQEISLSDNQIGEIALDSFKNLQSLHTLRLDKNRIEGVLAPGLEFPSLKKLNMSHNYISHVHFQFFHDNSRNMLWIDLDNNLITSIDYGSFESDTLQELYLNNNHLGNIGVAFLWGMSNLVHLEMKNNHIEHIAQFMLGDLTNLMVLNLDNNDISYFAVDVFDIEYDPRQRLQPQKPSNIRKMYISNNRLSYPSTLVIGQMPRMDVYSASGNTISYLRSQDLPDHGTLAEIDLSLNGMYAISADSFSNLPALNRVDLRGNLLQSLSRDVFEILPPFLFLGGNPLMCDCNLSWLKESAIDSADDAMCAAPKALESMALSSLDESDFHCSIEVNMNSSNAFSGVHGQDVLLECPVMSENEANIQWLIAAYNHTSKTMVLEDVTQTDSGSLGITKFPNGSLYLHTILHEQNTNYTCRATNNVDQRDFLILLRVEGSNGTDLRGGKDGYGEGYIWQTGIMTYILGGGAGALFLIALTSIVLAFFLSNKRLQKMASVDSPVKELSVNKQYEDD